MRVIVTGLLRSEQEYEIARLRKELTKQQYVIDNQRQNAVEYMEALLYQQKELLELREQMERMRVDQGKKKVNPQGVIR